LDAFKRDERRKGNTKLIQAASISFVFICIAILSFYDPNILDTTSAYISAAIGLAGTVYSFFYKGFRNIWKNEE
jgi:O-antigen/teichoic acid export membrane protein